MKRNYRVLSVLMIFMIMIGGTGCMFKESPYKKIEKYLKEKYDNDKFTDARPYGGQFINSGPVYEIECKSELHPEFPIIGTYNEKTDTYYDNYMSVIYAKQYDEYVEKNVLDELFGEGNYYHFNFYDDCRTRGSDNYYKDMTFEEFMADIHGESLSAIVDVSCLNDQDAFLEKLTAQMEESGIDYKFVSIHFITPFDKTDLTDVKIHRIKVDLEDVVHYLDGEKIDNQFEYTWER